MGYQDNIFQLLQQTYGSLKNKQKNIWMDLVQLTRNPPPPPHPLMWTMFFFSHHCFIVLLLLLQVRGWKKEKEKKSIC